MNLRSRLGDRECKKTKHKIELRAKRIKNHMTQKCDVPVKHRTFAFSVINYCTL